MPHLPPLRFNPGYAPDVASLTDETLGANYTFVNGPHHTTVDYCIVDYNIAHTVLSCTILPPDVLNLSDHLPIVTKLDIQACVNATHPTPPKLNWHKAREGNSVSRYNEEITSYISCLLQYPPPASLDELNAEIVSTSKFILDVAHSLIPTFKQGKNKKTFYISQ